jgi:hypothetical protein
MITMKRLIFEIATITNMAVIRIFLFSIIARFAKLAMKRITFKSLNTFVALIAMK